MSQALYRKYRPKTFFDVIGQEQVTSVLENQIAENHIAHAYLFTGSRGTGKTSCSKILAKAVNCLNPINGNPCGECEICKGIEDNSILDVVEMDAASNNGVDDIRALREQAEYTPNICKYRVYIIDEVHMLSISAFNAFLKILEEPPAHIIFILATTEVHKIPATILSRCQSFDFKRISPEDICKRLKLISEKENINLLDDGGILIAKLAKGGMRDALSILDVCAAQNLPIDAKLVAKLSGLSDTEQIFKITDALIEKNCADALKLFDISYENSVDPFRLCEQIILHFRELMLCLSLKDAEDYISPDKNFEDMMAQAKKLSLNQVISYLGEMQKALDNMSNSTVRSLQLEIAAIKISSGSNSKNDDKTYNELISKINALENKITKLEANGISINSNVQATAKKPLVEPAVTVKEEMRKKATPLKQWLEIKEKLQEINPALYGSLNNSKAYVSDEILLVECENEVFLNLVRENEYSRTTLRRAAFEVTGKKFKLGPFKKDLYKISNEKDPLDELINKLDMSSDIVELK